MKIYYNFVNFIFCFRNILQNIEIDDICLVDFIKLAKTT